MKERDHKIISNITLKIDGPSMDYSHPLLCLPEQYITLSKDEVKILSKINEKIIISVFS
jgi:hypothetical protein